MKYFQYDHEMIDHPVQNIKQYQFEVTSFVYFVTIISPFEQVELYYFRPSEHLI